MGNGVPPNPTYRRSSFSDRHSNTEKRNPAGRVCARGTHALLGHQPPRAWLTPHTLRLHRQAPHLIVVGRILESDNGSADETVASIQPMSDTSIRPTYLQARFQAGIAIPRSVTPPVGCVPAARTRCLNLNHRVRSWRHTPRPHRQAPHLIGNRKKNRTPRRQRQLWTES